MAPGRFDRCWRSSDPAPNMIKGGPDSSWAASVLPRCGSDVYQILPPPDCPRAAVDAQESVPRLTRLRVAGAQPDYLIPQQRLGTAPQD